MWWWWAAGASCGCTGMKEGLVGTGWVRDQVTHQKKLCFCAGKEVRQPDGRAAVDNGATITPLPPLLGPISQLPLDDRGSTRTCCQPPSHTIVSS